MDRADAAFGSDIDFLNALPKELYYFAAIKSDTQVFIKKPKLGLAPYKGRWPSPQQSPILSGQPNPEAYLKSPSPADFPSSRSLLPKAPKGRSLQKWPASVSICLATDCRQVISNGYFFAKTPTERLSTLSAMHPKRFPFQKWLKLPPCAGL